jgi:hypothetical protein
VALCFDTFGIFHLLCSARARRHSPAPPSPRHLRGLLPTLEAKARGYIGELTYLLAVSGRPPIAIRGGQRVRVYLGTIDAALISI